MAQRGEGASSGRCFQHVSPRERLGRHTLSHIAHDKATSSSLTRLLAQKQSRALATDRQVASPTSVAAASFSTPLASFPPLPSKEQALWQEPALGAPQQGQRQQGQQQQQEQQQGQRQEQEQQQEQQPGQGQGAPDSAQERSMRQFDEYGATDIDWHGLTIAMLEQQASDRAKLERKLARERRDRQLVARAQATCDKVHDAYRVRWLATSKRERSEARHNKTLERAHASRAAQEAATALEKTTRAENWEVMVAGQAAAALCASMTSKRRTATLVANREREKLPIWPSRRWRSAHKLR